jgi:hypothetical protein
VRVGIIALTDCSSSLMAHELGLFTKHGIESTISEEASWAVVRDRLTLGDNQATHMRLGIPTLRPQPEAVRPLAGVERLLRHRVRLADRDGGCKPNPVSWDTERDAPSGTAALTCRLHRQQHPEAPRSENGR